MKTKYAAIFKDYGFGCGDITSIIKEQKGDNLENYDTKTSKTKHHHL